MVLEPGVIKTAFWHQIGVDPESIADQPWTPIPDIVQAWNEIISDEDGIPGGMYATSSLLWAEITQ